jgi:hypothetical protein
MLPPPHHPRLHAAAPVRQQHPLGTASHTLLLYLLLMTPALLLLLLRVLLVWLAWNLVLLPQQVLPL